MNRHAMKHQPNLSVVARSDSSVEPKHVRVSRVETDEESLYLDTFTLVIDTVDYGRLAIQNARLLMTHSGYSIELNGAPLMMIRIEKHEKLERDVIPMIHGTRKAQFEERAERIERVLGPQDHPWHLNLQIPEAPANGKAKAQ